MRTPEAATMNRNTASTTSAMTPASIPLPPLLLAAERRGAPDLHAVDALAGLDHGVLVVRASRPALALQLHAAGALVVVDALGDHGAATDERRRAGAQRRRHPAVRARERAQRAQQGERDDQEGDQAERRPAAEAGHHRGHESPARERREEEPQRGDLADAEDHRSNQPENPVFHPGAVSQPSLAAANSGTTTSEIGVGMPCSRPSRRTTPLRASHSRARPASRSNRIDEPRSSGMAS